ncbi:MAG TPA: hypothetical protein VFE23_21010 [Usitatibacter sp.]|jgi:hypothetical protein|nr:hypothetical protein [Usitatibacter sp.]
MKHTLIALVLLAASGVAVASADQQALDGCIAQWGRQSPFHKGTPAETVVSTGVKVFGVGSSSSGNDSATGHASLILVRPAVNVMGKSTIRLNNPKGWYCFRSNVNVAGKMEIEAPCDAHIASATSEGAAVGASDDTGKGVSVFGALRVTRYGCKG